MKLIYAQGFSKSEKLEWKPVVFNNIVQAFRLIFDAMNELEIKFENDDNEASPNCSYHPSCSRSRARGPGSGLQLRTPIPLTGGPFGALCGGLGQDMHRMF
jgi:hypothetical protein